jgi:cytochrome c oxidase subunit III
MQPAPQGVPSTAAGLALSVSPPCDVPPSAEAGLPARRVPGNKGIWVGIICVFVEFAALFTVYFVARAHFPGDFEAGHTQLSLLAGATITFLLLTSSLFIALSVNAIRADRRRQSIGWLIGGLVLALGYPLVKYLEFRWNLSQGIKGDSGIFFTVYYYLTLTHLVHGFWGILGIIWVLARNLFGIYSATEYAGLEALASYWHVTDMIWLIIFSLCYVLV